LTDLYNDTGEFHFPSLWRWVRTATTSYYAAFAISAICSAVTIPILLHRFGAENFGIYTLAISLATLIQLPFSGMEAGGTQIVSGARSDERHCVVAALLRTGIPLSAACSAAICLLLVITCYLLPTPIVPDGLRNSWPILRSAFALAACGIPARCAGNLAEGMCVGLFHFRAVSIINAGTNVLQAIGIATIAMRGGGIANVLQLWVAIGILSLAAQVAVLVTDLRRIRHKRIDAAPVVRELVRQTGWIGLDAVVLGISSKADEIIISMWASAAAVGYYAIAFRVPSILLLMISQYASVYVPIVANADNPRDRSPLRRILLLANRHVTIGFLPVAAGLIVWAKPLLTWWIGPHSADVAPLLRLAMIATIVTGTHQLCSSFLYGLNESRTSATIALWQTLFRIALAVVLVRNYGAWGVALSVAVVAVIGEGIFRARALLSALE